jgi:hypothetical protein
VAAKHAAVVVPEIETTFLADADRVHLRGLINVTKRYLITAAAHNLSRILRRLTGVGKPKVLQGEGGGFATVARPLFGWLQPRRERLASYAADKRFWRRRAAIMLLH